MMQSFSIRVPGSSANLGPGFDSIGVAFTKYLTLKVTIQEKWEFIHVGPNTPEDTTPDNHLIYKIAQEVAKEYGKEIPPCRIEMESELPLARGLGSSAAAIVAAIELANITCDLQLTTKDKLSISSRIEGHPDNASASVLGGFTISAMHNGEADTIAIYPENVSFVAIIPNFELKTSDARAVLPTQYEKSDAVRASANANMLVASLLSKDYERVGRYMEEDVFHEPYRASLIPYFYEIKQMAKELGAYGTALSGAGPTMISLVPTSIADDFAVKMQQNYDQYAVARVDIDKVGVQSSPIL